MNRKAPTLFLIFLLVSVIAFSTIHVVYGEGQNWLADEPFRTQHTINELTGATANYQVNMTIYKSVGTSSGNTAYLPNIARTDFGDVRFTTDDGSTELPYWIERTVSNVSAIFWIKLTGNLGEQEQKIYIYYGNSTFTTTSNAANVFNDVYSGLIQALPMDENTGTATNDYSGSGINGTLSGANIGWGTGKFNSGVKTTGASSIVSFGTSTALDLAGVTISFWFKPNVQFAQDTWQVMWCKYKDNNNRAQIFLDKTTSHLVVSLLTSGTSRIYLETTQTTWSAQWYYLTATIGTTNSSLYINGNLVTNTTNAYSLQSVATSAEKLFTDFYGGAAVDNFNGTLDSFMIWNTTFGSDRVTKLYNNYPMVSIYNLGYSYLRQYITGDAVHGSYGSEQQKVSITFYMTGNTVMCVNGTQITNGTTNQYIVGQGLSLLAGVAWNYTLTNWSWNNSVGTSTTNPYVFTVTNATTIWLNVSGLQSIYDQGYNAGWANGNATGYSVGWSQGNSTGWIAGNSTGYNSGWSAGNLTGYTNGFSAGYSSGYSIGWADGNATGYSAGWSSGNLTGYNQGWIIGNQSGYIAGYNNGFIEGWIEGNVTGYGQGWDAGNYTGYITGWTDGNFTGWTSGNATGFATGYDIGYAAGFEDGSGGATPEPTIPPITEGTGIGMTIVAVLLVSVVFGSILIILVFRRKDGS